MDEEVCTICFEELYEGSDNVISVYGYQLASMIVKSKALEDNKWKKWKGKDFKYFHENCKKQYSAQKLPPVKRKLPPDENETPAKRTANDEAPSAEESASENLDNTESTPSLDFEFDESLCFFCNKIAKNAHDKFSRVMNPQTLLKVEEVASRSEEDNTDLIKRLNYLTKSPVVIGAYHNKCYNGFYQGVEAAKRKIERELREAAKASEEEEVNKTVQNALKYIENSGKNKFTLRDLRKAMGDDDSISNAKLMKILKETVGNDIVISHMRGQRPVIYYKPDQLPQMVNNWLCGEDMSDIQKKTILNVASEILRKEINDTEFSMDNYYPPSSLFLGNVTTSIPPLLRLFLGDLLVKDGTDDENFIKRDNIAHAILSVIKPKAFTSPLQLALGTYIRRKTGSKFLIDLLSKLGVCSSYYSLQQYEFAAIEYPAKIKADNTFVQFVWENTNHKIGTENQEKYHCLGGIAVYTPSHSITFENGIKKCNKPPNFKNLGEQHKIINVSHDNKSASALKDIFYLPMTSLQFGSFMMLKPHYTGYLYAKYFEIPDVPSWKGFMENVSNDMSYSTSHVRCLPFINDAPSKLATLNTALRYTIDETQKLNQNMAIVTFDMPFYHKARSLVTENDKIFVRLGSYHLLMSFMGAIGQIMSSSGIEEMWTTVFKKETLRKLLTGHSFTSATRAHMLSFTAVGMVIIKEISPTNSCKVFIEKFFKTWTTEPRELNDFSEDSFMAHLNEEFIRRVEIFEKEGPTAKLWVQYFKCAAIVLQFIEAERLSDWKLYLQSVESMLPIFHATGLFQCARSTQVFLQDMIELESRMEPDEFDKFTQQGFFSVRREHGKPFTGTSPDMVFDQTFNRFFETDVENNRGVTNNMTVRYLQGLPAAVETMDCLESYCQLKSSSKSADLSTGKISKDTECINKFVDWLSEREPFKRREELVSLSTGIVAEETINCHMAIEKGREAMSHLIGKNVDTPLSNVYKIKTLSEIETSNEENTDNSPDKLRLLIDSLDEEHVVCQQIEGGDIMQHFEPFDPNSDQVEIMEMEIEHY